MSKYSILPLLSSTLFLSLGLFCYLKNRKSKINLSFALMCLSTFWWQGSWVVLFNIKDPHLASILVKIGYSGIIFIPITFYHFIIELLNRNEEKKIVWLSYGLGIIFLISLWSSNLFIKGYYTFYWGYYPKASLILHPIYLLMLSAQALRMLYLLYKYLKKKQLEPIKRNQVKFMFWAIFFYTFASADFANNYGLEVYPFGVFAILISFTIIAYTIAKHKMLDIHFVIRKTTTNLLMIAIATFIVLFTYYPRITLLTLFYSLTISSLGIILIPKIKPKVENKITHILYKGKYDYLDSVERFVGEKMVLIPKEEKLIKDTMMVLSRDMYAERVTLLIRDPISGDYLIRYKINIDITDDIKLLQNSKIVNWLIKEKKALVLEEEEKILPINETETIKKELEPFQSAVCIPARIDSDLIGIIAIGNKTTGEMYTHVDLELLERLGIQLAMALDYKRIEAQLRKEQELVSIGQLSLEISHEMRNLLQLPSTFIDLSLDKKNAHDDDFFVTFRNMAIERMKVTKDKLDDIMYLGRDRPPDLSPNVDINNLLENNLIANELSIKKMNIEVVKEFAQLPMIKADKSQLTHLFNNLILNAIDAMEEKGAGGKLRIRTHFSKNNISAEMKDRSNEWVRVEVKDDGNGIPDHVLKRLFTPFVTTKSLGHIERKGTGLGLSVVKKVVDAHKGYINAHTKEGKGTTFVVDLPVDLKPSHMPPPE